MPDTIAVQVSTTTVNGHPAEVVYVTSKMKIILIGVGNSGTKILGKLIHELINHENIYPYYYEPLYWKGNDGEKELVLNESGIQEHINFPLLPDNSITQWPWMDRFLDELNGLAKFIRAGSRISLMIKPNIKFIWITRELHSFLGSMQQNFPRESDNDGWHHRPGHYDDYLRLKQIYTEFELSDIEERRVEVEAAWWHLHNSRILSASQEENILHIRYEDLCIDPVTSMRHVANYIDVPYRDLYEMDKIFPAKKRQLKINSENNNIIESLAGSLNNKLYPEGV